MLINIADIFRKTEVFEWLREEFIQGEFHFFEEFAGIFFADRSAFFFRDTEITERHYNLSRAFKFDNRKYAYCNQKVFFTFVGNLSGYLIMDVFGERFNRTAAVALAASFGNSRAKTYRVNHLNYRLIIGRRNQN